MDPLLLEIPETIHTARLILRAPRAGDGPMINEAVRESIAELVPWMPWATPVPTPEDSELWCRKAQADFITRRQLPMLMFLQDGGMFLGCTGIARLNWDVPWFEVGH